MSTTTLRVAAATIKRFLGIEEARVEPGKVTIIRGKNETAKTSLIEGVRAALGGGTSLTAFQRIDPATQEPLDDPPQVLMEIDGAGSEKYLLDREGDELGLKRRVGDTAAFEDVPKPQAFLSGLFDGKGCNPVAFLQAKDADRARMLLEALPLKLDRDALDEILGEHKKHVKAIPDHLHPLEYVGIVRDMIFEARTGVNRDQKAKAGSAEQLRRNLPAVLPEESGREVAELETEVSKGAHAAAMLEAQAQAAFDKAVEAAKATKALEDEKVTASFREAARKLKADQDALAQAKRSELDAYIAKREKEHADWLATSLADMNDAISGLKEADELRLDEIDAACDSARAVAEQARQKDLAVLDAARTVVAGQRERLAALRASKEEATKVRERFDMMEKFDAEATQLDAESKSLTATIEGIDGYARRMAEDIPIEGLSIRDKVVTVKGVPYGQLNTAQRIGIAVKVAALRASATRLPLLFVDGAEALDSEHFEVLVKELLATKLQAFITRVEDHETVVERRS